MAQIFYGTAGTVPSSWTTAGRPSSPVAGQYGYNTTIGSLEIYNGSAWGTVGGGGAGSWQAVQASNFAAVAGNAYAVNTTSSAITVTLPASPSVGNYIQLVDYAGTWSTNAVTLSPNGLNINASTSNVVLSTNRQGVAIVYIDSTQGWICYSQGASIGPYSLNYLIVAGGGAGGGAIYNTTEAGGGGAGGVLTGTITVSPGTAYTIAIGGGGSGSAGARGGSGTSSSAFSYTATGGGGGGGYIDSGNGLAGGSGGGGGVANGSGGAGTTGQGYVGGSATGYVAGGPAAGGGGGGAGAVGGTGTTSGSGTGGAGGIGVISTISGASTYYAGGGGGGAYNIAGAGGTGGGGAGGVFGGNGTPGTVNTGGGGGGAASNTTSGDNRPGASGGSGIVIISYTGAQRGTGGTVTSSGGYTIHTFTTSSSYTA